jgi:hypothetical protein
MELSDCIDERTSQELTRLLPGVVFKPIVVPLPGVTSAVPRASECAVSIDLPAAQGAEYSFWILFEPERQIGATLVGGGDARLSFWYRPFEDAEFRFDTEKRDDAFFKTLESLISHETRIVQRRGLISNSFQCDFNDNGEWKRVFGVSSLRWIATPPIGSRERVYSSPALMTRAI